MREKDCVLWSANAEGLPGDRSLRRQSHGHNEDRRARRTARQHRIQRASIGRAAWFGVYILPQLGIPIATVRNLSLSDEGPAQATGAVPVFIGSDSEGRFGRQCPRCGRYWRSSGFFASRMTCAYCGLRAFAHSFVTDRQKMFLHAISEMFIEALAAPDEPDGWPSL